MVRKLTAIEDSEDSSVLHLEPHAREIDEIVATRGWPRADVDFADGELRYTLDSWATMGMTGLCVLPDDRHGFVIEDLPPDTEIEYAIRLRLRERVIAQDLDAWLNNGGRNYRARTELVLDLDD
jgi:hypothetical protein